MKSSGDNMSLPKTGRNFTQVDPCETGTDSQGKRAEEFDLGPGTICLAGANQMVVAQKVIIRGLWDGRGELYGLQLELSCEQDQWRVLRELKVIPEDTQVCQGVELKAFFEMEASQLEGGILSELGEAQSIGELFLAEDRFPPILNLLHYELRKVETQHSA